MIDAVDAGRYLRFDRDEWAALRAQTPLTLEESDLAELRGTTDLANVTPTQVLGEPAVLTANPKKMVVEVVTDDGKLIITVVEAPTGRGPQTSTTTTPGTTPTWWVVEHEPGE